MNVNGKLKMRAMMDNSVYLLQRGDQEIQITVSEVRTKCENKSPTNFQYEGFVDPKGIEVLYHLLKQMCYDSEGEPALGKDGRPVHMVGLRDEDTATARRGCILPKNLQLLDDWWFKFSPLKGALRYDELFRSEVISPELFKETKMFYRRQNFAFISHCVMAVFQRVETKLKEKAAKVPKFDMAAALCPIQLLHFTFSVPDPTCSQQVYEKLMNPLTMLGLRKHPWYFDMTLYIYLISLKSCPNVETLQLSEKDVRAGPTIVAR